MRQCEENATPADSAPVTTGEFCIGKGALFSRLLMRFGMAWMSAIAVLFIAFIIVAIAMSDLRWVVLSLMVLFIVMPMCAAWLYFNYGLREECWFNTSPHVVSISPEAVTVKVRVAPLLGEDGEEEVAGRNYDVVFTPEHISPYSLSPGGIIVPVKKRNSGFLILPYDVFDSKDDFSRAVKHLVGYNS